MEGDLEKTNRRGSNQLSSASKPDSTDAEELRSDVTPHYG